MSISERDAELIEDLSYRSKCGEQIDADEMDFLRSMFEADEEAYVLCHTEGVKRANEESKHTNHGAF